MRWAEQSERTREPLSRSGDKGFAEKIVNMIAE